ncbi:MAG TPA: NAD(P)/FAD-dependent oxidoreductase [Mycobacteriales bacterium]|nr:NAD(P)/FAD-dependent oxidoreductase [Mycobacteriales bacterium]
MASHADGTHYDVIIVGARCAGSSLATLLARQGLRVAAVEAATFPKTTLSSHLMEADALLFLKRLGVLDSVRATGVRFMRSLDVRLNDARWVSKFPLRFDDVGGAAFLRRHLLDSILADAAIASGADIRFGTKVVELLWQDKRVCGVRVVRDGVAARLYAPLVVGADGQRSTVAYMAGARKYNVNPNERSYYFTFFEGATAASADTFVFHRWGDRMVWGGPADSGLFLVGVSPEQHEREYFRTNTERGLLAHLRSCPPMAAALGDATVATKISGIRKFDGYFRQASGPGWVLAGDAGHFKDPSVGRGIGDAFLQTEALAPAIVAGLDGTFRLEESLRRWGSWRDRYFEGHYYLATTLGRSGTFPSMVPEAVKRLARRGELDRFFDLFSHRAQYDDVFPLTEVAATTGRMVLTGGTKRVPLVREAITLLAREPRRRWVRRRPALAPTDLTAAPSDRLRADPDAGDGLPVPAPHETAATSGGPGADGITTSDPAAPTTALVTDGSR